MAAGTDFPQTQSSTQTCVLQGPTEMELGKRIQVRVLQNEIYSTMIFLIQFHAAATDLMDAQPTLHQKIQLLSFE